MKQGWKKKIVLYVRISNRYRRGVLIGKIGTKWDFLPDGSTKTKTICPFNNVWRYNFKKKKIIEWPHKIRVLFLGNSPFKLRKEREGKWCGAVTGQTTALSLRVWQIAGTALVFIGHLGQYRLTVAKGRQLSELRRIPGKNDHYYIGKGPLDITKFKPLKIVAMDRTPMIDRQEMTSPLYKIPTREELG